MAGRRRIQFAAALTIGLVPLIAWVWPARGTRAERRPAPEGDHVEVVGTVPSLVSGVGSPAAGRAPQRASGVAAAAAPEDQADPLARVAMVLVFRGSLSVPGTSATPDWAGTRFAIEPASSYAVWIGLRLSSTVEPSGRFEVRAECRRTPETRTYDDEYVLDTIHHWTHFVLKVRHPLLQDASVEVAASPWPPVSVAGPQTVREFEVGEIDLSLASGVLGRVVDEAGRPVAGALVALYLLDAWDELEPGPGHEAVSAATGEDGRYFLHEAPRPNVLIVAAARDLAPAHRQVEIVDRSVADLGDLTLARGQRIAGRVELTAGDEQRGHVRLVLLDGVDPPLRNTREAHPRHLTMIAARGEEYGRNFCWTGGELFWEGCAVEVAADGTFEIGGLSPRCYRMRVVSPCQRPHWLESFAVTGRSDIWNTFCAPTSDVVLPPTTSTVRLRLTRTAADGPRPPARAAGLVTWRDAAGSVASHEFDSLEDASFEALPGQVIDVRFDADPSGRVHSLVAPPAGELASFEIEVPGGG